MFQCLAAIASGLVELSASVTLAAAEPAQPVPVTVEPVTLLANGEIAGCGVKATARPAGTASVTIEIIAFRSGDATEFVLKSDAGAGAVHPDLQVVHLQTTSHDTRTAFPSPVANGAGQLETRTRLEGFTGASFVQELLVSGASITAGPAAAPLVFSLPRPMPHGVRQAYLNCAGDLFRPEQG